MQPVVIPELQQNDPVRGEFVLVKKEEGSTRGGKPYFAIEIRNETGSIGGKVWSERMHLFDGIEVGDAIEVQGIVVSYKDERQIDIRAITRLPDDHAVRKHINPVSPVPLQDIRKRFEVMREHVEHAGYRTFLDLVLAEIGFDLYFEAPAAMGHHHAYIHGLAEHSVEVAELSYSIAQRPRIREQVNLSALIASALLHDAPKAMEYDWKGRPTNISKQGRFAGHLTTGPMVFQAVWMNHGEELMTLGLTEDDFWHLVHLQVSHHGKPEWGSPVEPRSLEAVILHHADAVSAEMNKAISAIEAGTPDESGWIVGGGKFWMGIYAPLKANAPAERTPAQQEVDEALTLFENGEI